MSLCLVDNLLCVIQQEGPKQDETSIHCHTVKTESHGKWSSHVKELVTWSTNCNSRQSSDHSSCVPGCSGQDGSSKETEWSHNSSNDCTVS